MFLETKKQNRNKNIFFAISRFFCVHYFSFLSVVHTQRHFSETKPFFGSFSGIFYAAKSILFLTKLSFSHSLRSLANSALFKSCIKKCVFP